MEMLKKAVTMKTNAVYDVDTMFIRLLVMKQHYVDINIVFQYELSPAHHPPPPPIRTPQPHPHPCHPW